MRLGLLVAGGGGMLIPDMAELGRRAETAGFDAVLVPESWRSGVAPVAAIAAVTTEVEVGPYVLNAHARTPLSAGMDAVDLDQLSGGRLVLGVGSGNEVMNASGHGVPVVRPLEKMRDYLGVLGEVTRAPAGSTVAREGTRHYLRAWRPQAVPEREQIPILLAATSPRMTDLAADAADGIALGALQSASFVANVARRCRSRSPHGERFAVYCAAFTAVHADRDTARAAARRAVVDLFAVKPHPHYERLLHQQGYAAFSDQMMRLLSHGDVGAAQRLVPDEVVDTLTIAGTPQECQAKIQEYSPAVDALVLSNVAAMQQITAGERPDPGPMLASYDVLLELAGLVRRAA